MSPGGIERADPGLASLADIGGAVQRLSQVAARPGTPEAKRRALQQLLARARDLEARIVHEGTEAVVYLDDAEFALKPRLRSAAIEIDFSFGDRDGRVGIEDLGTARQHYGQVRGPVGWNRLLLTDEIERRLYPERTLRTTEGLRLLPDDWLSGPPDPLAKLKKVARHLDDSALARTYADVAARLATVAATDLDGDLASIFEGALVLLGTEIRGRNSVRPTITDIARIGCEDPKVKEWLRTPIEMSRRLQPWLIDRYLLN